MPWFTFFKISSFFYKYYHFRINATADEIIQTTVPFPDLRQFSPETEIMGTVSKSPWGGTPNVDGVCHVCLRRAAWQSHSMHICRNVPNANPKLRESRRRYCLLDKMAKFLSKNIDAVLQRKHGVTVSKGWTDTGCTVRTSLLLWFKKHAHLLRKQVIREQPFNYSSKHLVEHTMRLAYSGCFICKTLTHSIMATQWRSD